MELLELLGDIDFKLVSYLESICPEVKKGQHHFIGVSKNRGPTNREVKGQQYCHGLG